MTVTKSVPDNSSTIIIIYHKVSTILSVWNTGKYLHFLTMSMLVVCYEAYGAPKGTWREKNKQKTFQLKWWFPPLHVLLGAP